MDKYGKFKNKKIGLNILDKMDGKHGLNMIETILKEGVMFRYDVICSFLVEPLFSEVILKLKASI